MPSVLPSWSIAAMSSGLVIKIDRTLARVAPSVGTGIGICKLSSGSKQTSTGNS